MKSRARRKRIYVRLAASSSTRAMAIFDAIAAKGNDSDVSPAKMVELFERAAIGLSEDPGEKVPFRAAGKSTAASMDELLAQFDIKTHGGEVMACNPVGKEKYE